MSSSSNAISDSFWKPPILKKGEYDWWVKQIESHICSLDGQILRVIEVGPLAITNEKDATNPKPKVDYTDGDWKKLEKNCRAKKILHMTLLPSDLKKIMSYKTAKEIWDALKRLHQGNEDTKKNKILSLMKEYDQISQENNEHIQEFYSRFQGLVGQLEFLGEAMPDWKLTHHFMQGLNSQWDAIALALYSQTDVKALTIEEVVAKLESNASVYNHKLKKKGEEKVKSIALKVERAFDLSQVDDEDEDGDVDVALITRAMRKIWSQNKDLLSSSKGNRDLQDV